MDKPLPTLTDQDAVELPALEKTHTELRALEEHFQSAEDFVQGK